MNLSKVLLLLFFSANLIAQNPEPIAQKQFPGDYPWTQTKITESTPAYAKEMYKNEPNFNKVIDLYNTWRILVQCILFNGRID